MKKADIVLGAGAVLAGALTVVYLLDPGGETPAPVEPPVVVQQDVAVDEPAEEPPVRYPVAPPAPEPEPSGAEPESEAASDGGSDTGQEQQQAAAPAVPALPPLDESDDALRTSLSTVVASATLESLFNTDTLVRRFVVTVDNLPGKQFPRSRYRLARSAPGLIAVRREGSEQEGERLYLSPENFTRYGPFVEFVSTFDAAQLVSLYRHYYALFQQAYEELGYPASAYFNDRLVDVIDHLLETPDIDTPIQLLRPHVLYRYQLPELEGLSSGQKVLLRIGPEQARALKAKLREVRGLLVTAGGSG
jgi:hypothetical protein